jgi:hypothetical protein
MALAYPDLVNGGIFYGLMGYYRWLGDQKKFGAVRGFWRNPPQALLDLDRQSSRFVFQSTSKLDSVQELRLVRDAMIQDGFKYVTYLEDPNASDIKLPAAEWFDKCIVALDAPLSQAAQKKYNDAQSAENRHLWGDALSLYRAAAAHSRDQPLAADAQAKAEQLGQQYNDDLKGIQSLMADQKFTEALAATHKLQDRWGKLAADKGSELLKQIAKAQSAATTMPERSQHE